MRKKKLRQFMCPECEGNGFFRYMDRECCGYSTECFEGQCIGPVGADNEEPCDHCQGRGFMADGMEG